MNFILRNVNTPTLRLEIWTFLVELLPEGYPNIYVGEEFILNLFKFISFSFFSYSINYY